MNMISGLNNNTNFARTENGALVRSTTNSAVLDFFSVGGAIRSRIEQEQVRLFTDAWAEDELLALKAMFYFRDVRGGQGQRDPFRVQLSWLAEHKPEVVRKNLPLIANFGRWDDLYVLFGTELEKDVISLFKSQLNSDIENMAAGDSISLLGKWLKSENASSAATKKLAHKTRKGLGMSSKEYRKMLSALRCAIEVLERHTSKGDWNSIDYSKVPSQAMFKSKKAFFKHDKNRIEQFLKKVENGEKKINAATLYPQQIVHDVLHGCPDTRSLINAQWEALPNYCGDTPENAIAVVDTSGSMSGTPMEVAIGIGMYLAERATGPYKDHFITFSATPKLQKIVGHDVWDKVQNLRRADWGMNTNLEAVFTLILDVAVQQNLSQDEILDKLYIISDMEFDSISNNYSSVHCPTPNQTLFNQIRKRFEQHGYKMPDLVFWNVDSRNDQQPMSMDDRGFQNVSGYSPSIFASLMTGEFLSAYDMMINVLNNERYSEIKV